VRVSAAANSNSINTTFVQSNQALAGSRWIRIIALGIFCGGLRERGEREFANTRTPPPPPQHRELCACESGFHLVVVCSASINRARRRASSYRQKTDTRRPGNCSARVHQTDKSDGVARRGRKVCCNHRRSRTQMRLHNFRFRRKDGLCTNQLN